MHGQAGLEDSRVEPRHGDPLALRHVLGENTELSQNLDRAGRSDALDGRQLGELPPEPRARLNEPPSSRLQGDDPSPEVPNVDVNVATNGVTDVFSGMMAILLLRPRLHQASNPASHGSQLHFLLRRWSPWLKRHSLCEFQEHSCVESVRLGSLHVGTSEISGGSGVDNHDLDALGLVKSERQPEVVMAAGLQDDAGSTSTPCKALHQVAMPAPGVGKAERLLLIVGSSEVYVECHFTDVDSDESIHRHLPSSLSVFLLVRARPGATGCG
jgi:hypothetical protein